MTEVGEPVGAMDESTEAIDATAEETEPIGLTEATLEAKGIGRGDVDWVLTTHVHLDHAGGAGALMRELPNARCAVHPRRCCR